MIEYKYYNSTDTVTWIIFGTPDIPDEDLLL